MAAAHPKLVCEVNTSSGSAFGIEGICSVDPGNGFLLFGQPSKHGKGQGGTAGTQGPH